MSKKHFIALANAIKAHNGRTTKGNGFNAVQLSVLADFCASQNANFNRQRWFDYINGECGPSGGTVKKRNS